MADGVGTPCNSPWERTHKHRRGAFDDAMTLRPETLQLRTSPSDGLRSLRLLAQAAAGMVVGVFFALAATRLLFPPDSPATSMPAGMLSWNLHNIRFEPREKGFYLLSLVLGALGAFLATRRMMQGRAPFLWLCIALVLAVPLGNTLIRRTLQGNLSSAVGFLLGILAAGSLAALLYLRGEESARGDDGNLLIRDMSRASRWPYPLLLLALTVVLVPSSVASVAAAIASTGETAMHVVSFLIGPALYFSGTNLLPGRDYFSQYSIGLGWVFSWLLGDSPGQAMTHYVAFLLVGMWLFYAHLTQLLHWLYRSWIAAAAVSFLSLILLFVTPTPFFAPSSTVLRYPLLTVCAALLAWWTGQAKSRFRLATLAAAIACAIFLNTETGIDTAIAIAIAYIIVSPWRVAALMPLMALATASALAFLLLIVALFGPALLSLGFFRALIEPLTIYGVAGFGAWPIDWTLGNWYWLYNLVAPGTALATLAVIARVGRSGTFDKPRSAVLAFFAVSGLLMSAKYVNMSIVGVWQMNALGFFVALGWWSVAFVRQLQHSTFFVGGIHVGNLIGSSVVAALLAASVGLAGWSHDPRNPSLYGMQSWVLYPSLLRTHLPKWLGLPPVAECVHADCGGFRPAASDIELIQRHTHAGEQVAIVSDLYDWTYLIAAHRAPLMFFLPSSVIFTERQLQESVRRLRSANYLFVPKTPDGKVSISNSDLRRLVLPLLERQFERRDEGERLVAWERKPHSASDDVRQ